MAVQHQYFCFGYEFDIKCNKYFPVFMYSSDILVIERTLILTE